MKRPRTPGGRQLRSFLGAEPEPRTAALLKEIATSLARAPVSGGFGQVAAATLTILVRRRFVGRPSHDIARYAHDVVLRAGDERSGGELARAVEATIRAGLGETWAIGGVGRYTLAKVQLVVLRDLVAVESMTPDVVDEIIAFAEVHRERQSAVPVAVRSRRFRRSRSLLGRLRLRAGQLTSPPAVSGAVRAGPTSLVGRQLRAAITNDPSTFARTPDDPRDDDAAAVIDALFELAMQRRFRSGYHIRDVMQFVQLMAHRTPQDLPAPFIAAEAIVRSQLGEPIPIGDIDRPSVVAVKALASRAAISDLALLDHELDDLLVEAERLAGERGFQPTPAPPSRSAGSVA